MTAEADAEQQSKGEDAAAKETDRFIPAEPSPDVKELKLILALAFPVALATGARIGHNTIDTAFIGHLGTDELAASAYATTWYNILSVLPAGFCVCLIPLCGQALGSRNLQMVGVWVQVGGLLAGVVSVLMSGTLALTTKPIVALLENNDTSRVPHLADEFNMVYSWVLVPFTFFQVVRFFFQALREVNAVLAVTVVSCFLDAGFNALYIHGAFGWDGWGLRGSAVATHTAVVAQLLLLAPYVVWWRRSEAKRKFRPCWTGFSRAAFTRERVWTVLKQGTIRGLVIAFQQWPAAAPPILASHLGKSEVAANGVLYNVQMILFAVTWGWGLAVTTRGAEHIGKGDKEGFRRCVRLSTLSGGAIIVTVCFLLWVLREQVGRWFTSDHEVLSIIKDSSGLVGICIVMAFLALVFGSGLDACCMNKERSIAVFITNWVISMPFCVWLGLYTSLEVRGFWVGLAIGATLRAVALCVLYLRIDLDAAVQAARIRQEVRKKASGEQPAPEKAALLAEEQDPAPGPRAPDKSLQAE